MKKIKKRKTITDVKILLAIAVILNFSAIISCEKSTKDELWYVYAIEYIKADEIMVQHMIEKKETFPEDYDSRYKAESRLLNSPSPKETELEILLNSQNLLDRKVALVNIRTRHIYSENLFKTILKINDPKDAYLAKLYVYQSFNFLDTDKIKQYEDEFINMIYWESNEGLIISAMPTLLKMDRSKIVPLFVKFFEEGRRELRKTAYVYSKKMDDKFLKEIKSFLYQRNAIDALNFIKEAELGKNGGKSAQRK